jgi:hypothetical protein
MAAQNFPYISIGDQQGSMVAATTSTFSSIPTMSNGDLPKYLFITATGGSAGTRVTIAPSNTSANASQDLGFVLPCDRPISVILNVHGYSIIRHARRGGGTSLLWMYPLEDL